MDLHDEMGGKEVGEPGKSEGQNNIYSPLEQCKPERLRGCSLSEISCGLSGLGAEVQSLPSQRTGPESEPAAGFRSEAALWFSPLSKLPTGNSEFLQEGGPHGDHLFMIN
ncbi:hypothetical protein D4764_0154820 [Takifugu flavidus]|uniref:Uncharacterized protein n=1 Tax=Takifugu flavidus TaxID=433684 RepID=A0A5C6MGZ6_9TELE|nr:hypothetical protein D4764_0154820 [Takifugu flavidus]